MADDNFEKKMEQTMIDGLEDIFDRMAEQVAKELAKGIVEEIEENLTHPFTIARKPFIFLKIAEELQKYVEKASGEVKVSE